MVMASNGAPTLGRSALYKSHRSKFGDPLRLAVITASDECGLLVSQWDRTWVLVTVGCALQLGYGYKIGFNLL